MTREEERIELEREVQRMKALDAQDQANKNQFGIIERPKTQTEPEVLKVISENHTELKNELRSLKSQLKSVEKNMPTGDAAIKAHERRRIELQRQNRL